MSALASPARMDVETQLAVAKLFRFVSVYVLRLVARNGVPAQEQEDLAQEILVAAWQGWPGYDPDREGTTPRGWLCGIVANKVVDRRRKSGRDPLALAADDRTLETLAEETMVATEQRSLLARLSAVEQRVIFYREDVDLTFQEIAQVEKAAATSASGEPVAGEFVTSETDARRHYQHALTRLRRMVARDRQKYGAIVPLSFKSLFPSDDLPEPPPEMVERVIQRACAQLGFDAPPPPSGAYPVDRHAGEPAPTSARPAPNAAGPAPLHALRRLAKHWLAHVGLGAALGVVAASALSRCGGDRQHRNAAPEGAERAPVPVVVAPPLPGGAAPALTAAPVAVDPAAEPGAHAAGTPARRFRADVTDSESAEAALIRQARAAAAAHDAPAALRALDVLARQFPAGSHSEERARVVRLVCIELRGTAPLPPLCAGEP